MHFKDIMHGQKFTYLGCQYIKIKKFNYKGKVWNALSIDGLRAELNYFYKDDWVQINEN